MIKRLMLIVALVFVPGAALADTTSFQNWLAGFRGTAIANGISPATLDRAFAGVGVNQRVVELDRHQPEFTRAVWDYLDSALSETRIRTGRAQLARHSTLLNQVADRFGVPARYLVAFWGLETNYGSNTGGFNVIEALATLAHDGRRRGFGESQLLAALKIIQAGDTQPQAMLGSWAGAMGQVQFIPTTYLAYAIDWTGDGTRDIWRSVGDAMGSAGNFLNKLGWVEDELWGREVTLPAGFDYSQADPANRRPVADWAAMGVTRADGRPLPAVTDVEGAIILPGGHRGPAFLVYKNFRVIMGWNNSTSYALAVGLLSDALAGRPGVSKPWPRDLKPLSRTEVEELQGLLAMRGFDPGPADGLAGPNTRSAIRAYQSSIGAVPDGFPTQTLLNGIRGG